MVQWNAKLARRRRIVRRTVGRVSNWHPAPKQWIDENERSVRKGLSRASRHRGTRPGGRRPTQPVRDLGRLVTASTADPEIGLRTSSENESRMTSGPETIPTGKASTTVGVATTVSDAAFDSSLEDPTFAATESSRLSRSTGEIGSDGGSTD